ncbi:MAG: serine hydrolase domain-containing protein [Pseudomonadota bacterium]
MAEFTPSGKCPHKFLDVAAAFSENFEKAADPVAELGASFAVLIDGEVVIDLWHGHGDRKKEVTWAEDTLPCIYSSGKAVLATLVARAVSDGVMDYARPIAADWPEFGQGGKGKITLEQALSHQAGLCGFPDEMNPADWLNWEAICKRLEQQEPLWEPGTKNGYHPQTIGFIAGEVFRRQMGASVGEVIRRDYFDPQGIDLHCGIKDDAVAARTVEMIKPNRPPDLGPLTEFKEIAFLKKWSQPGRVDAHEWLAAELPASNMHATAVGLAGIVHPLACNGECQSGHAIDGAVVADVFRPRISGEDLVLPFKMTWGAGLMRNPDGAFGPIAEVWGHAGSGGSAVIVDPERRLTAAYVMNRMSPYLVGDPRARRLFGALYGAL